MLSEELRKQYMVALGYTYNKTGIKKMQSDYMKRKSDIDGIYGTNTDILLKNLYNFKLSGKVSHFKITEFTCECNGKYCSGYPAVVHQSQLAMMEAIRNHWGKPITVTCGLRCSKYNASLGGSIVNSKHKTGYATDYYQQGVTDTLANRKSAIKWIKKQSHHTYTYGNGINSKGVVISAPYMGNALHTDTDDDIKDTYPELTNTSEPANSSISETKTNSSTKIKGMDISEFQGKISVANFKKAKASGIDFVILRLGYTGSSTGKSALDCAFETNYKNATASAIPVGVYYYTLAKTVAKAKSEADFVIDHLKNKNITYPVYIDIEDSKISGLTKSQLADIADAFCETIATAGYTAGVYASTSWWTNKIGVVNSKWEKWVAQYYTKCEYKGNYSMWQYSSTTKVPGIADKADVNYCYKEFADTSKSADSSISEEKTTTSTTSTTATKTTTKTVKIGQATSDERGKLTGGKVGDQTGKEVAICNYVQSNKEGSYCNWQFIARCKDATKAKKMAHTMAEICRCDKIGYDQKPSAGRSGLYKALKAVDYDVSKLTKKVDTSCTPSVCASIRSAGIPIATGICASELRNALEDEDVRKHFVIYKGKGYTHNKNNLRVGDILCSGKHTAMVVSVKEE